MKSGSDETVRGATAFVFTGAEVHIFLHVDRNPFRMFNYETVHIRDVEGPIGTDLDRGRAEPDVGRGKKLAVLFAFIAMAFKRDAVTLKNFAVDDVVGRV
jgi:hypothetical protein